MGEIVLLTLFLWNALERSTSQILSFIDILVMATQQKERQQLPQEILNLTSLAKANS